MRLFPTSGEFFRGIVFSVVPAQKRVRSATGFADSRLKDHRARSIAYVMPSGRFAVTRDNAKSIRSMRVMFITPSYTPAGVRGSPAAMTTLPRVAPRGCAPPRPRHRTSAPCCSIAPVGAVVIRTAAIPIPAIKVGIATIKSEATSISEAAAISEAASEIRSRVRIRCETRIRHRGNHLRGSRRRRNHLHDLRRQSRLRRARVLRGSGSSKLRRQARQRAPS